MEGTRNVEKAEWLLCIILNKYNLKLRWNVWSIKVQITKVGSRRRKPIDQLPKNKWKNHLKTTKKNAPDPSSFAI